MSIIPPLVSLDNERRCLVGPFMKNSFEMIELWFRFPPVVTLNQYEMALYMNKQNSEVM